MEGSGHFGGAPACKHGVGSHRSSRPQVVLDVLTGVQSQAEACRKHASVPTCWPLEGRLPGAGPHPVPARRARDDRRAGPDRRAGAGAGADDPGERDPKKSLEQAGLRPRPEARDDASTIPRMIIRCNCCARSWACIAAASTTEPRPDEDRPLRDALIELAGPVADLRIPSPDGDAPAPGPAGQHQAGAAADARAGDRGGSPASGSRGRRTAATLTRGSRTWSRAWRWRAPSRSGWRTSPTSD